jgi:poly(3-hydroxybutyrate) depolymerase
VLSAPKSVARWAHLDGCTTKVAVTYPLPSIKLGTYSTKCHLQRRAILRTIFGGGHVWGGNVALLVTHALGT